QTRHSPGWGVELLCPLRHMMDNEIILLSILNLIYQMDWTHRLRLRNVKMLLSLAQTRNISHSAAALNTTQPGLSKWLKDLEDDIGLPLFERHARGLRPTSYGEVLIAHAQRLDAQLERA